ncbi:retroviral-like aspartic protease family protein [Massilia agilis]|uniref:Retroviral-like aspartic protease family protein n=1 Tax=Massilia agilis TaxID=1811226 RepID=A0ABT2DES6_9BURK|nr:retroviral-like aspartic protease family protein [Massilia agilis]MCS0809752.1 retroviral-like aspartic protease family protein [Massilia agilis]
MYTSTFSRGLALLAALLCASAASADDNPPKCQYVMVGELPLRYSGPGLALTTEGRVNGTPATVLINTGGSDNFLTRTLTERLDLPLSMTGKHALGIGGYSRLYQTRLSEFAVGPARAGKGHFMVLGDTGAPPPYDATVGAPFLLQADMEVSLAEKKLRFFRPRDCGSTFLGYWSQDVFTLPYVNHFGSNPNPHFMIEVNGKEMTAQISTGAASTAIMSSAARKAGLRLDSPNSARMSDVTGVGTDRVGRWSTTLDTLKIGAEVVRNAEIEVLDTSDPSNADVLLGDDFLRAHRVLFAMSQGKLYISYLGGEPFKLHRGLEPWVVQEAESGNPDAQLVMAGVYRAGRAVPRDDKQADAWLEKAAALGHPQANLQLGRRLMAQHRYADAAGHLRRALDAQPASRASALWLYIARLRNGQPDLAKQELEAAFSRGERGDWPSPIADFYLGKIDAAALLDAAGKESDLSKARTCAATLFMSELYGARDDTAQAEATLASWRAHCAPAAQTASAK